MTWLCEKNARTLLSTRCIHELSMAGAQRSRRLAGRSAASASLSEPSDVPRLKRSKLRAPVPHRQPRDALLSTWTDGATDLNQPRIRSFSSRERKASKE
jgi:hypothetical protein